jgi:hypothetical protein
MANHGMWILDQWEHFARMSLFGNSISSIKIKASCSLHAMPQFVIAIAQFQCDKMGNFLWKECNPKSGLNRGDPFFLQKSPSIYR